jgi:carbon-monoxide dehydrogenase small subunit
MKPIVLTVNGVERTAHVAPETTLLELLRNEFSLTGAKRGCDVGDCGACTVVVDGKAVNACLMLVSQANGRSVLTIEGLATKVALHPLQQAFEQHAALQCGFCGPGVILSAKALLDENEDPDRHDIREALAGHLCRCTGYVKMIEAVEDGARVLRERRAEERLTREIEAPRTPALERLAPDAASSDTGMGQQP